MDYIAVSISEQYFIPMTQRQVDDCKGDNVKICNRPSIVNRVSSGLGTCEVAFYKGLTPPLSRCATRITYVGTSMLTEIPGTLGWLFVIPREESLTITCIGPDEHPEHDGTEWVRGTGILTQPAKCEMVGSTFTIYSRAVTMSTEKANISDIIKIPSAKVHHLNISNEMYDIIAKKIADESNHLRYVTNMFQDLKAASIKLNMLDEIMIQCEPNNFVPEPRHYI